MPLVRLVHWNAEEAEERAKILQAFGYEVVHKLMNPSGLRELRENPPDAIVIDLTRLPSQGRDVGMNIRKYKSTCHVPLLFVGGDLEKVNGIKEIFPDATYTDWNGIRDTLEYAIANPPTDPVRPESVFDVYKGTPLQKKLGLKPDTVVALLDAPEGFGDVLGEMPDGVTIQRQARGYADLTLWFTKSKENLERQIEHIAEFIGEGHLWIIWPKKTSKVKTDLTQTVVRRVGLDSGLVDFKICSVNAIWSGLCFTRRNKS
jgi:CheY-like chemotaxis protein